MVRSDAPVLGQDTGQQIGQPQAFGRRVLAAPTRAAVLGAVRRSSGVVRTGHAVDRLFPVRTTTAPGPLTVTPTGVRALAPTPDDVFPAGDRPLSRLTTAGARTAIWAPA